MSRIIVGKVIKFYRIRDRLEEAGRWVLITECRRIEDRKAILGKGREIWKIRVDEDLSIKEKRKRWKMLEVAR